MAKKKRTRQIKGQWYRQCNRCQKWKTLTAENYSKRSDARNPTRSPVMARQAICRPCRSDDHLERKYGLTEEEVKALKNYCQICGRTPPEVVLNVDHCHSTERVRGRLCNPCNRALGLLQDNPEVVKKAYLYLKQSI